MTQDQSRGQPRSQLVTNKRLCIWYKIVGGGRAGVKCLLGWVRVGRWVPQIRSA